MNEQFSQFKRRKEGDFFLKKKFSEITICHFHMKYGEKSPPSLKKGNLQVN